MVDRAVLIGFFLVIGLLVAFVVHRAYKRFPPEPVEPQVIVVEGLDVECCGVIPFDAGTEEP